MKRFIYKILYPLARVWWFLIRPKTQGVKCVIERDGKLLMIRNSYGNIGEWTFPGGGIEKGESPEAAVIREVREETGIEISGPRKIGEFPWRGEWKRDTVYCFYALVGTSEIKPEFAEIQEAKWFPKDQMPESISDATRKILEIFFRPR